jgi:OOP family OmpA-OmpF porin
MTKPFTLTRAALAVSLALAAGAAGAVPGYVTSTEESRAVTDASGNCWRTGDWAPDKAAAPCDAVPRAAAPAAPISATEKPVEPAPIAAAPPSTVIEKVTLSSDVLFEFDKAELRPEGRQKLDELAANVKDARVDRIEIVGHADRIGSEKYNEQLSQKRAEAVQAYLAQKVNEPQRIQAEGRGEAQPVTGNECAKMGPERKSNRKLVDCLQPDRRVDVEVLGQREVAATPGTPSTGSSAPDSTSGSAGSGAPAGR